MVEIPNLETINKLEEELKEEYNLEKSRLSRYQSMNPELIEFAQAEGLKDPVHASHALFLADFVVTSSEVPAGLDDEARRRIIINIFKILLPKTENPENITKLFYIAYKLAVQIRRTDSFLGGRGIKLETRKTIIMMTYVIQFIKHAGGLIDDEGCSAELSILFAALKNSDPSVEFEDIQSGLTLESPEFIEEVLRKMAEYSKTHNVDVNDTIILPHMDTSQMMYISTEDKELSVSEYKLSRNSTEESTKNIEEMMKFLHNQKEATKFLYLRGRIVGEDNNIILVKHPQRNTAVLMHTDAEEANVSELLSLMELQGQLDQSWKKSSTTGNITEDFSEVVEEEEEELVETTVDEEIEVDSEEISDAPPVKKKGFFGRIKSLFGGSDTSTEAAAPRKEKKVVKKTLQEKVKRSVKRHISSERVLGNRLSTHIITSMGILTFSDLRLYEIFDTIRESEYSISGAIYSNFKNDTTEFLVTQQLTDPQDVASKLDGLDEVIERVVSHYFGKDIQILPTEIIYLGDENERLIISMDGDKDKIVGTIAQTYRSDFTDYEKRAEEDEKLQRRSLHMRTGQLLSALMHTPFDHAVERIHHLIEDQNATSMKLERAILKLD